MPNTKWRSCFGLLMVCLLVLGGCVSKGEFEGMVAERDVALKRAAEIEAQRTALAADKEKLETQRQALLDERATLSQQIKEVEAQKAAAAREAEKARAEIARQREVYQSLQQTFAKEQEQNQVKIEMMKSGVKVNLANDILFASGSAALNDSGVDVIKRVAGDLQKNSYQILIAGYTDNVPISGARYPSNWELAGARATSVVRLLEAEGVPAAKMLAISFGENSPIESNDTPEGRKQNRRIEMLLRPVPIEMR